MLDRIEREIKDLDSEEQVQQCRRRKCDLALCYWPEELALRRLTGGG